MQPLLKPEIVNQYRQPSLPALIAALAAHPTVSALAASKGVTSLAVDRQVPGAPLVLLWSHGRLLGIYMIEPTRHLLVDVTVKLKAERADKKRPLIFEVIHVF